MPGDTSTPPDTWDMPTSSATIFPKAKADRLENEENIWVLWNDGCCWWLQNYSTRWWRTYCTTSDLEEEGQSHKSHDHAVHEEWSCHQGFPCQMRQGILEHICVRVQSSQLWVDYAIVQTSNQATPCQQRHLCTCHQLSGSNTLPRKCWIWDPWLHRCSYPTFYTSIWSTGPSFLEQSCCWHENQQVNHHPLLCHKWHTRREAMSYQGWHDQCAETRASTNYS